MNQPDTLSDFDREYLSRLGYWKRKDIEDEFLNCARFRRALYDLREDIYEFIKNSFEDVLTNLAHKKTLNNSAIKRSVLENIRTVDINGDPLGDIAEQRKELVLSVDLSNFKADWRTFAICYSGPFLAKKYKEIRQFNFKFSDPKLLLEILRNCSLFSNELYEAACEVRELRNKFYAHLPVLIINSETYGIISNAVVALVTLLRAQRHCQSDLSSC